jgi:hypothetical protein
LIGGALLVPAWGRAQESTTLDQAVRDRKIEVSIRALGGSTGDTILIDARKKVPQALRIRLEPGTVFRCVSGGAQDMVGVSIRGEREGTSMYRPESEMVLTDDARHPYVVEAYCLDFHKSNPDSSDTYSIGVADERAKAICEAGKRKGLSIQTIQVALWLDRSHASASAIKSRFSVSDSDIAAARELLKSIGKAGESKEGGVEQSAPPVKPAQKLQTTSGADTGLFRPEHAVLVF